MSNCIRKRVFSIQALASGTSNVNVNNQSVKIVGDSLPEITACVDTPYSLYSTVKVWGTTSLTGVYNISPTGTPAINSFVEIYWKASLNNGATYAVNIFGKTVPSEIITAKSNFKAECIYNGEVWDVTIISDAAGNATIGSSKLASNAVTTAKITDLNVTTAKVADDAITFAKMQNAPANSAGSGGTVVVGNDKDAGAVLSAFEVDNTQILIGNADGFTAAALSGDATMTNAGVVTVSKLIGSDTTQEATAANTNPLTVATIAIPANTLASDGDAVEVDVYGSTAGNTNNKTISLKLGGTSVVSNGTLANPDGKVWRLTAHIQRTGATSSIISGQIVFDGSAADIQVANKTGFTWSNSNDITVVLQNGTSAASDITFEHMIVKKIT
tara:strand:- start:2502 stop:3659 length:1158 start_codon:yes stop_codon:yes gene_type:complete